MDKLRIPVLPALGLELVIITKSGYVEIDSEHGMLQIQIEKPSTMSTPSEDSSATGKTSPSTES